MTSGIPASSFGSEAEWWWCLRHEQAESPPDAPAAERMGPYATKEAAERALDTATRRTEEWDQDPAWNDEPG